MKKMHRKDKMDSGVTRIAVIHADRCKPSKCAQECRKECPVVRMGRLCIEVRKDSPIATFNESLCIGCGACVKKCPFDAVQIINLPKNLENQTIHRYGKNTFKLHRLPTPKTGCVLGLVGTNGIGKSTALKILSGKEMPNLGRFRDPPSAEEILQHFRGSELQAYFTKLQEGAFKALIKPQYVDVIPEGYGNASVARILKARNEVSSEEFRRIVEDLELLALLDRKVKDLSGGELQRFSLALTMIQNADIYMFDEPSSYLDIRQRLQAARMIRALTDDQTYVICVEHDLSILDYLSDYVCVLYGQPGAYGVVTMPYSVREGINVFLHGFIPTENLRFRDTELSFRATIQPELESESEVKRKALPYPSMEKTLGSFHLSVEAGSFQESEILVLLGENGMGKTTLIRMLAGMMDPDDGTLDKYNVSYKPQKIAPKYEGSVRSLLLRKIQAAFVHPPFNTDVLKPLKIEELLDQQVMHLSGGELQRVAIALALGKPASIYLLDEPSAYLDSEQRVLAAKVIKRFILHAKKTAFVVEHDFTMSTYMADRVIVYSGQPGVKATAHSPQPLAQGMNTFLSQLGVTFRRDPSNYRPRINKLDSVLDQEQKRIGTYFYVDVQEA